MSSDGKSLVLQSTDIVELIGQTVKLRRSGRNYVGLCPFHQEKSGSFYVYTETSSYYCFGCKESGNAIDFVIKRDRLDFRGALEFLADRAGVELPKFGGESVDKNEKSLLLEAQSNAAMLFEKWLAHGDIGHAAREYLESRGFTAESIKRFRIGVTRESWDSLLIDTSMKKFGPELLHRAGLVKQRDPEKGPGYYDTFRNRLMFPIRDEAGRVIAFGGRVMPGSDDKAKYLNSPETMLFNKSRCMYGIDQAKQKIVETGTVAVVEGYTDVIMAHQYGCSNVVSVLGTALTSDHVSILKRFADRIVLLFDPDAAGDVAVNRALELFLSSELEVAVATIPEDLDPDEFLLKHGAEGFNKLLDGATDALSFKWKQLSKQYHASDDVTGRQKAIREYMELIAAARHEGGAIDSIRWGEILVRVSRMTEIPVADLRRQFSVSKAKPRWSVNRPARNESSYNTESGNADNAEFHGSDDYVPTDEVPGDSGNDQYALQGPLEKAERWVLGVLLRKPEYWANVQQQLQPAEFVGRQTRALAEQFWDQMRHEGEVPFNELLGALHGPAMKSLAMQLVVELENTTDLKLTLTEALNAITSHRLREEELKTLAELRRNSETRQSGGSSSDDEIELLKKMQTQAKRTDLRRSGS